MGIWGPGNFDSDYAMDYVDGFLKMMVEKVRKQWAEVIDDLDIHIEWVFAQMEITVVVFRHLGRQIILAHPDEEKQFKKQVRFWKKKYFEVWDREIEQYDTVNDYAAKRRQVIVKTFDDFIDLIGDEDASSLFG